MAQFFWNSGRKRRKGRLFKRIEHLCTFDPYHLVVLRILAGLKRHALKAADVAAPNCDQPMCMRLGILKKLLDSGRLRYIR